MSERDTPRRIALASATIEENGNGHGDSRVERPITQADRIEHSVLEHAAHLGNIARDTAILRVDFERETRLLRADHELHRGETKRIADAQAAMRTDIDGIAKSVGAHRTFSGSVQIVREPSPLPPTTLDSVRSPTGEHQTLTTEEYDRIVAEQDALKAALQAERFARQIADAETRGAKDYAARLEADNARKAAQKKADDDAKKFADDARQRRNENLRNGVLAGIAIIGSIYTAIQVLAPHIH